jgi:cyclin B
LAIAALMVAGKYEEIYPPTVKDYLYVTKNAYTKPQLFTMEKNILFFLEF